MLNDAIVHHINLLTRLELIMEKILYVKKKNVYGNELVYPVCKDAKLFVNLLKQETFTSDDIARIKSLGYVFKHVEEKI